LGGSSDYFGDSHVYEDPQQHTLALEHEHEQGHGHGQHSSFPSYSLDIPARASSPTTHSAVRPILRKGKMRGRGIYQQDDMERLHRILAADRTLSASVVEGVLEEFAWRALIRGVRVREWCNELRVVLDQVRGAARIPAV
jgi:hypothetical protein